MRKSFDNKARRNNSAVNMNPNTNGFSARNIINAEIDQHKRENNVKLVRRNSLDDNIRDKFISGDYAIKDEINEKKCDSISGTDDNSRKNSGRSSGSNSGTTSRGKGIRTVRKNKRSAHHAWSAMPPSPQKGKGKKEDMFLFFAYLFYRHHIFPLAASFPFSFHFYLF